MQKATEPYIYTRLLLFIFIVKYQNILYSAGEYLTQIVNSNSAYRLIMLKSVQKTSADAVLIDKLIGTDTLFL